MRRRVWTDESNWKSSVDHTKNNRRTYLAWRTEACQTSLFPRVVVMPYPLSFIHSFYHTGQSSASSSNHQAIVHRPNSRTITVRYCLSLLLLATAASTASAQQQQQQASSFRSTPSFETQAVTPSAAPAPKQPAAPKAAGGGGSPESLYKQQRVEYTFPLPVSLAPVQQDGNGTWCCLRQDKKREYFCVEVYVMLATFSQQSMI